MGTLEGGRNQRCNRLRRLNDSKVASFVVKDNRGTGEGLGDTNTTATATSTEQLAKPLVQSVNVQPVMVAKKREKAWKQRLTVPVLVLSDLLLVFVLWGLGILVLYGIWGHESPLVGPTATYILASTVVWIGLRALLGLYPGYGLAPAEELRRQSYATLATLVIATLFAFAFQVGDLLPRLLVGLNLLERLFLAPIGRHLVKRGLAKLGLWGKPVIVVGAGKPTQQLVRALSSEWGLGFVPVAIFDFRLAPQ